MQVYFSIVSIFVDTLITISTIFLLTLKLKYIFCLHNAKITHDFFLSLHSNHTDLLFVPLCLNHRIHSMLAFFLFLSFFNFVTWLIFFFFIIHTIWFSFHFLVYLVILLSPLMKEIMQRDSLAQTKEAHSNWLSLSCFPFAIVAELES